LIPFGQLTGILEGFFVDEEILGYFMEETAQLLSELEATVESIEDAGEDRFPEAELRDFAQKIDRVMGAAKTLDTGSSGNVGVAFLGKVSEACKGMGYQAIALKRAPLIPVFAAFWAETIEVLSEVVSGLKDPDATRQAVEKHGARLQSRLNWLAERVAPANEEERLKVQNLLKNL
jgi:chemotaxis protein histidine kinase CheA